MKKLMKQMKRSKQVHEQKCHVLMESSKIRVKIKAFELQF